MTDLSTESSTLALSPPYIADATPDVKSEDPTAGTPLVGVPLRLTAAGILEVVVDPSNPEANSVTLHLNGAAAPIDAKSTVDPVTNRTTFAVPRALLRNGLQFFHYVAKRIGGNDEPSPKLWAIYSRNRPGGVDPVPDDNDIHEGLGVDLPEAIKQTGVGPEEAARGVPLTVNYSFAKLHDVVTVDCNGFTVKHIVTQENLGGAFDIPLPEAAFIGGGNSSAFEIFYRVRDQLGNDPENSLPSPTLTIVVDLTAREMDQPDLIEDMAGDDDDAATIDRSSLKDFLLARVHVRIPLWKKGDFIRLTYICIPAKGAPVTRTLADVLVSRVPDFPELKIPAAHVHLAAKVQVSYSLVRSGKVVSSSDVTKAEVVGGGSSDLPAPFVPGLVGNRIPPGKYPDGFTMRVDWDSGWKELDKAHLVVAGGSSGVGTPIFKAILFNSNRRANFDFHREFILANANRTVTFFWKLLRAGREIESQPLTLFIERINASDPNFPSAEVVQANGSDVVDLRSFTGDAQLVCAPWPFIGEGQRYRMLVEGTALDGSRKELVIANGNTLTQAEIDKGLDHVLPRKELVLFKPGHQLTVRLQVDFYPNENADTIVTFKLMHYTLVTAGMHDTLEFLNAPYVVAPAGRLTNVVLKVVNKYGDFIKDALIQVTIPSGSMYDDGGTGRREFKTNSQGEVSIVGVKISDTPGAVHTLIAEWEGNVVKAEVAVTARAKVGVFDLRSALTNDIALNPDGTKIYVLHAPIGNLGIEVLDAQSLEVVDVKENLPGQHIAISPDGWQGFIGDADNVGCKAITLKPLEVLGSYSATHFGDCVFDRAGDYCYVVGFNYLMVYDTVNRRAQLLSIPGFRWTDFVAFSSDGRFLYVCGADHLSTYDVASQKVIKKIAWFLNLPGGFAISPDGSRLYVCRTHLNSVEIYNALDLSLRSSVSAANRPGPIVLSSDGRLAFYGSMADKRVRVFDTATLQDVRDYNDLIAIPKQLAISPDDKRLYVGHSEVAKLTVLQIG